MKMLGTLGRASAAHAAVLAAATRSQLTNARRGLLVHPHLLPNRTAASAHPGRKESPVVPWYRRVYKGAEAESMIQAGLALSLLIVCIGIPAGIVTLRRYKLARRQASPDTALIQDGQYEKIQGAMYAQRIERLNVVRREQGLPEVPTALPPVTPQLQAQIAELSAVASGRTAK
jgi:hypothetical protein